MTRPTGIGALLVVGLVAAAAGCGTTDPSVRAEQRGKPVVITGLWPIAEAAQRIGGNAIVVVNLTPVGDSPHELKLTSRERSEVVHADLAIVMGKGFQPDLERVAAERTGPTLDVLASLGLPGRPDASAGPVDPHVWLDPSIMGSISTLLGTAIAKIVPKSRRTVRGRAHRLVEEDVRLDAQLAQALKTCRLHTIASQHEAFDWFAARYGLANIGFDGTSPDADPAPDPVHLSKLTPKLDDGSMTTLFIETLAPTSWVEVIAEEHGLDTAVLNPYEGLTAEEEAARITYRSVLLYDLRVLQDQLDCQPT